MSSFGFEEIGYIFDIKNVDIFFDECVGEFEVVLKGVFGFFGVGNVIRVIDSVFNDIISFFSGIDINF